MLVIAAMAALFVVPVSGQTDTNALEQALHGKPLGLRSYSADPVARYTWIDGKLVNGPVELHGIRAFFTDTVSKKGNKILIDGQVETLVRDNGRLAPMGKEPMRLEIDLQGADSAAVIPQLMASLFFPNLQSALASLPEYVSDLLPFPSDGKFQSTCHCSHILQDGKWTKLEENSAKLVPPSIVKAISNDALNQKALDAKVSGTMSLIYVVSETGHVDEVWVAKPLGSGLDEFAARAARENIFHPSMLDGKPVGTILFLTMSVN